MSINLEMKKMNNKLWKFREIMDLYRSEYEGLEDLFNMLEEDLEELFK